MKLVTTFHHPSSVTSSLKCNLAQDSEFGHLVVAKTNRVEVFSLTREGLKQECEVEIWGRVLAIRAIPVNREHSHSNLLILTDHPDPRVVVLAYQQTTEIPQLVDVGSVALHDRIARHAEFCNDILVDPTGAVAIVSCYAGKLRVLTLKKGLIEQEFDVSLPELNLLSISFLHAPQDQYSLAIIHLDFQQRMQLICRDLNVALQELVSEVSQLLPSTMLSPAIFPFVDVPPTLIPVSAFSLSSLSDESEDSECPGGLLVAGGRKILFYQLARPEDQTHRRGNKRRLEKRKASVTESEVDRAKEKEKAREMKKLKPKCYVRWPWSEITSWDFIEGDSRKFILGDKFGRISLLTLDDSPRLILLPVGEASPSTSLTHLASQVIYVGSHLGPSQLLRIHQEIISSPENDTLPIPAGVTTVTSLAHIDEEDDTDSAADRRKGNGVIIRNKGVHLEVLDSYRNISPIMDAVLADTEYSGQPQIVTCSGGANTGSLNAIRSGAEVRELAVVEGLDSVLSVYPIRSRFQNTMHSYLLVSTSYESFVLRMDGHDLFTKLEATNSPFVTSSPTLALSNISRRVTTSIGGKTTSSYVDSALVVQVTAKGIRILEFDDAVGVFHVVGEGWSPDTLDHTWRNREVVAASVNASQFVLALSGGRLALLNMADDRTVKLVKFQDFMDANRNPREICAVSCIPFDRTKHFSLYIATTFWDANVVTILSLEKPDKYMTPVCSSSQLPSLPRSVLLHNFGTGNRGKDEDYRPYVLAGLTDGTVVSFAFRGNQLQDKKTFGLGTAPVTLSPCTAQGRNAVFASGSRAAILHWDRKRLRQSSNIVTGVTVNTPTFPFSLVAATSSSLTIGEIGGIDKMQVKSIPLGLENPTRICHDYVSNTFGVACLHPTPNRVGDAETTQSSFNILDSNMKRLGQYMCEADEEITAVASSSSLVVSLGSQDRSCFFVGSVRHELGRSEPNLGRIMVFTSDTTSPSIRPLVSTETGGCVYALAIMGTFVVAAINTSVLLYHLVPTDDAEGFVLEQVSQWNHNYFVTSLVARDNTIIAGDAISSVSMLEVVNSHLRTVARDFGPLWPVAVELTPGRGVIGADCDCNLFTFSLGQSGSRAILERDGSYHLGEVVNKLLPGGTGAPDSSEDSQFQPEHLFFTSSGRVGQIVHVDDNTALHLTALQRNMAKATKGPGDVSHSNAHTPANSRGRSDAESAFGFLDGDFLELFLAEPQPKQLQLLRGELEVERVGLPLTEVEAMLEKLQGMH
ncbi:mono-functional DNA-alkylating methyl methanesulfonate N-term-domain-containing protein [Cristinia sonorae]|uniref:Mono-functional DNA-alkylating methyl methanesulfonate N-term-domain-containing protein n=1 Tax=Cristinia sonorae TaxID=1940300 RepID=A0A8K0UWH4_9AGAR|nr:mono-functional DNA-alkylating methyl methanesulfonate N-term-domain-containing protein [Cristinia sonorae]